MIQVVIVLLLSACHHSNKQEEVNYILNIVITVHDLIYRYHLYGLSQIPFTEMLLWGYTIRNYIF